MRAANQAGRRLFRLVLAAAVVPVGFVIAGSGTANATAQVNCSPTASRVNSPTIGYAKYNNTPVHYTGPYGDCQVNFYVSPSQALVLKCKIYNSAGNLWFNVSLSGDGTKTGWVYADYISRSANPGSC